MGGAVKRGSSTGRGAGGGAGGVNATCAGRAADMARGDDGSAAAMAGGGSGALRFRAMMMKAASPLMVKPRARPMRFATQARMPTAWRRTVAEFLQTGCPFFAGLGGGVDLGRRPGVWGLQRALRHPCGAPSPQPPPTPSTRGGGEFSFLPHVSQPLPNPPPRKARRARERGSEEAFGGDLGAFRHRRQLGPDHVVGHAASACGGVEAAIGAGEHAASGHRPLARPARCGRQLPRGARRSWSAGR